MKSAFMLIPAVSVGSAYRNCLLQLETGNGRRNVFSIGTAS